MPLFQIRYHGPAAPDPETLLADDPEQALVLARARFGASGAERATLSRAGVPMRGFLKNGDEVPSEVGRRLIDAGFYVFGATGRL